MKDFIGSPENRSLSDNGQYVTAVKEAIENYEIFSNFKRDPRYKAILEHVTVDQGSAYLEIIQSESPMLLDKIGEFKVNDLIGGPETYSFEGVGDISPSTLRYLKVASDLRVFFGEDISRVAEIGVGYGGQLLIADRALLLGQYDLFDLPPVLVLTSKYLESHILKSAYQTYTLNQHRGDVNYDLVICNYAFSELPSSLQEMYIKKILSKSKKGYLTMNSGKSDSAFQVDKLSISDLEQQLPEFDIFPELPLTHPGNYIIVWGHKP